jgi:hypothetical protein
MDGLYTKFQPANLNFFSFLFFSLLFLFVSCCLYYTFSISFNFFLVYLYLGVNFSNESDVGKSRIFKGINETK